MIDSIVSLSTGVVALIAASVMGISGIVSGVSVMETAIIVEHRQPFGVAFGGIAFANGYSRKHELGHLMQEQEYGAFYLPLIAIPSLLGNLLTHLGFLSPASYHQRWPENDADRRAGVMRGIR